jgi:peptide/nickel transport system permease protein
MCLILIPYTTIIHILKILISLVISTSKNILSSLRRIYEPDIMRAKTDTLFKTAIKYDFLSNIRKQTLTLKGAESYYQKYSNNNYIPKITWFGTSNQYHNWIVNLLHGDFGYSYVDTRPVSEKIWSKFTRSFTLILLSVILAYMISIPIGLYAAKKKGKFFDRFSSLILFILYAIPSFFFATLLLYFFSNPQYFAWFPESGYCDPEFYNSNWTFYEKIYHTFPYMVLPLITYAYASFAFLSRIIRSATLEVLNEDYIRTARAKGLSENKILWKHAFSNALLPVITTFVTIFPAAIGGSIIIETIFTYDGMGIASYEAVANKDIPMIVSIFSLAGFMSMVAYFIADILYAFVDPRISFKTTKK